MVREKSDEKSGDMWLNKSSAAGGASSLTRRTLDVKATKSEDRRAAARTIWASNEHSSQVLGAAQAIWASVLQCDRMLSVADSG